MLTENGLQVSQEALEEVLAKADVLTVGFTTFPERMLVDFRTAPGVDAWAGLVDPVATVQERYLWLGRHRGRLGAPQAFSFVVWPHSVGTMLERDALAIVRERLRAISPESVRLLRETLRTVHTRERAAYREAVTGGPAFHTLWSR
ncbi:MAG: hypothetical protein ACKVVT_09845 [Dehalococcoidia bacterium]